MSVPDVVVYSGHSIPMRLPFHLTPGMRCPIKFEIVDDFDASPVDQSDTSWTVTLHDALSGEPIFEFPSTDTDPYLDEPLEDNELAWLATAEQTALCDHRSAYEVRMVRDVPGPDMIAAGPVIFDPYTVPAEAAA